MIKRLSREQKYANKWMSVFEDQVEFPDGSKGVYGIVERKNGAVALVVNDADQVLLVKQYRYPIQAFEWNIPGGGIDGVEEPSVVVVREIEEETGLRVGIPIQLGIFYPLSSFSTEKVTLFFTRTLDSHDKMNGNQSDELFVECKFFSIKEALQMVDGGKITDSFTANAIQILSRKLSELTLVK